MAIKRSSGEVRYEGCVLATRERNMHDDSDFYAVVWDNDEGCLREVEYDTTRFAGGGSASVDATDEVKAKADDWLEEFYFDRLKKEDREKAELVDEGKTVRVVKGRKVKHGTEGIVFWMRTNRYGTKIGIRTSDRKKKEKRTGWDGTEYTARLWRDAHWTWARNVEVVNPEQYYTSDEELRRLAKNVRGRYHMPFVRPGYAML